MKWIFLGCMAISGLAGPGRAESPAPSPVPAPAFWVQDPAAFQAGRIDNLALDASAGLVFSPDAGREGVFVSAPIDAGRSTPLRLVVWIAADGAESNATFSVRASEQPFASGPASDGPDWITIRNGQSEGLPSGRFFQYRIVVPAGSPATTIQEVFLDTRPIVAASPRPGWDSHVMSMMYQSTLEKLHALYHGGGFNASERGAYILRNEVGKPITADDYRYWSRPDEMYLAARYGTSIIIRIHPGATFSPLTLRPAATVLRAKDGRQREGPFAQHRAINFFDEAFMAEYLTGIRAAVRHYKKNNPRVLGYNIAPPEFFYDTEPWPAMTYLGGFGDLAKARYVEFMAALGRKVDSWPAFSDGDISLDPDYYLWVYWRTWEASRYLARIARVIREEDPEAEIGALNYVGDGGLRGVEPSFLEINPDFTFYYSSNLYPRVPGADGLTGGSLFSLTRLNVLGRSTKRNLAEFDLWSPYVDLRRALTYARSAAMEHVDLVPIVFGDFLRGAPPSNHLTKYHGMVGEPLTREIIAHQGDLVRETSPLRAGEKTSQVAVVIPGFSLYGLLQKDRWQTERITQLQHHLLGRLLRQGVGFDLLSEGQLSKELLDHYKLVIYPNLVAYPWAAEALETTSAHVLALGWAGTVRAPGPRRLEVGFTPESFDLELAGDWPELVNKSARRNAFLPTRGRVIEAPTAFTFASDSHPLLAGFAGRRFDYAGRGRADRPLPYVADVRGTPLAHDAAGRAVFAVHTDAKGRHVLRFGGLLDYVSTDGNDTTLFSEQDAERFLANALDFVGAERYPDLGPLRVLRTSTHLLIENTGDTEFRGPAPRPLNPASDWPARLPAGDIVVPPVGSIVLPLADAAP